jgi:two-component system sporulation sensor kinase A
MGQALDDRTQAVIAGSPSVFEFNDEARSLSSRALNLVRDSVVALNPQGQITYLNPAAEHFYGWKCEEVVGRAAKTTLFTDSKEAFDLAWRTTRNHGEWRGQILQRTRSGAECIVEACMSSVCDQASARVTSILLVSTEVSNLNQRAAGLAHEIRNPLASIKGVADAFLQRRQLTRQEREWMEAVRYEVMKIDTRMRELLDVSQPRVFNVKECSVSELISKVVLLATHHAAAIEDRHNRKISIQFIDATTEPLLMALDSARIEDAVLNLVLNALESIEQNAGEVTVCLRRSSTNQNSANGDGEALIEVSDTGSGIPVEIRQRIFEPRFTTKRDGTGLGLAAVRRTAAAYHGRITFKTEIGRGSKFVLSLPLRSQSNLTENPQ